MNSKLWQKTLIAGTLSLGLWAPAHAIHSHTSTFAAAGNGAGIAVSGSGIVYAVGQASNGAGDIWIGRFDSALQSLNSVTFDGEASGIDNGNAITIGSDGNVYVTGQVSENAGGRNIWVARYNSSLAFQSSTTFNASNGTTDNGLAIVTDTSNNIYVAGTYLPGVSNEFWLGKFNSSLVFQSSATLTTTAGAGSGLTFASDGSLVVIGYAGGLGPTLQEILLAKYNPSNLVLQSSATISAINVGGQAAGEAIISDGNGSLYAVGESEVASALTSDLWIARLNNSLVVQSSVTLDGPFGGSDDGFGIARDSSGRIAVTGGLQQTGLADELWLGLYDSSLVLQSSAAVTQVSEGAETSSDLYGTKVAFFGNRIYVVGNADTNITEKILLTRHTIDATPTSSVKSIRAYPNPFRPGQPGYDELTFDQMPPNASIKVYTLTGALVAELTSDANGAAAWNVKNLSGENIASGVYYVLAEGEGGTKKTKVAIQR